MVGNSAFVMLVVSNMERSVTFYRDILGLKVMNQSPEWTELEAGGVRIGLHATTEKLHVKPNESYGIGFYVNNIERAYDGLKARDVHFIRPPKQESFGMLAVFSDPDGYHIQLCESVAQSKVAQLSCTEFIDAPPGEIAVHGFLHRPENATGDSLVLTHGAGANCESLLLRTLADAFCVAGMIVLRCDLAFRQQRPKGPPPRGSAARDQQGLGRAVEAVRREMRSSGRVYLGGHSYGGRQASMLASDIPALVDALLLLSYPLHPPKKPEQLRTAHLPSLKTPALFVHGARDEFASSDELKAAMDLIPARTEIIELENARHELISAKNANETAARVREAFLEFVRE